MARIIDLKNRKFQPQAQRPAVQNSPAGPRVKMAAAGFRPIAKLETKERPPPPQPTQEPKNRTINWSGPLRGYGPNMKAVVIISFALFAAAVLVQVFQKNLISTIFFALLGTVILISAGKKPVVVDFEINPLGVGAGEQFYDFRGIKSFWIEYEPTLGIKELSLQLKRWYSPYVKIPLYDQDPVRLRLALLSFLPEIEHKDTLIEVLSRKLGI